MKIIRLLCVFSIVLGAPIAPKVLADESALKSDAVSIKFPAFVTACQVGKKDKYFTGSPVIVLAFEVGSNYSVLYEHHSDGDKFLAEMHYDEGGLDAQGGVWSELRAESAYEYLSSRSFELMFSEKDYRSGAHFKKLSSCNFDYTSLDKYNRGEYQ